MAKYLKGSIQFTPVVEQINRKFATKKNVSGVKVVNNDGHKVETQGATFMGAGTRSYNLAGIGACRKNYFWFRENGRTSELSTKERQNRVAFTEGLEWAKVALEDLSTLSQNMIKFKTLSENPSAYIQITDGQDTKNMRANGYDFKGFMKAYGMKYYNMVGSRPSTNALPEVQGA